MGWSNFHFLLPISYFSNFDAQHLKCPCLWEAALRQGELFSACADKSPGAAHVFPWVIYSSGPTGLQRCPEVTEQQNTLALLLICVQVKVGVPIHQTQNICVILPRERPWLPPNLLLLLGLLLKDTGNSFSSAFWPFQGVRISDFLISEFILALNFKGHHISMLSKVWWCYTQNQSEEGFARF